MPTRNWARKFFSVVHSTPDWATWGNPQIVGLVTPWTDNDTMVRFVCDARVVVRCNDTGTAGPPASDWPGQIFPMIMVGRDADPVESVLNPTTPVAPEPRITGTQLLNLEYFGPSVSTTPGHIAVYQGSVTLDVKGQRKPIHGFTAPVGNVSWAADVANANFDAFTTWHVTVWAWARVLWETP